MMKCKNLAILIVFVVLLSFFAFAQETSRAVAHAQCAKLSKTICETQQGKNLVFGAQRFDCYWSAELNRCDATNFTIDEEIVRANELNNTIGFMGLRLALVALSLIVFTFFYFKKNISKEKPVLKKFVFAAIGIIVIELIVSLMIAAPAYSHYGDLSTGRDYGISFYQWIWEAAPLIATIIPSILLYYLVMRYYLKTNQKTSVQLGILFGLLAHLEIVLSFLLLLVITIVSGYWL